jgi:hypothetical protein
LVSVLEIRSVLVRFQVTQSTTPVSPSSRLFFTETKYFQKFQFWNSNKTCPTLVPECILEFGGGGKASKKASGDWSSLSQNFTDLKMPTAQYCPFVCRDACKLCVCVRRSVPWQCLGNWAQEDWHWTIKVSLTSSLSSRMMKTCYTVFTQGTNWCRLTAVVPQQVVRGKPANCQ